MAYSYDPYYDQQYGSPQQPPPRAAAPFQPAPTAPPIYPGAAGSSYTDWNGQSQTVPNTPPVNADQANLLAMWNGVGKDPQRFVQAVIARSGLRGHQTDPTALNTIARALQAVGVNATLDSRTDQYHKGLMVDGQFVKLLDGNDNWTYLPGGNAAGGGGNNFAIDPSFLAPYTKEFAAPADAALPNFQGPGAFKMPTGADLAKDPSYLWEEGRIRDSVQNSASAAGTLNTSGTLDRIMGSTSDFARTNFNNYANRQYGIWNSDWQHALDAYDRQFGRSNSVYNRAAGEYDLGKQLFQQNQDRPFNKLTYGVGVGANAASA